LSAQKFRPLYEESKIPEYSLPDPLIFNNGNLVNNYKDWKERRKEILFLFENEVYGKVPAGGVNLETEEVSVNNNALNGKAIRKEIKLTLTKNNKSVDIYMLMYLPKYENPVSVFVGCNFYGNQTTTIEKDVLITESWARNNKDFGIKNNQGTEKSRGVRHNRWLPEDIVARGYGVVTIYYGDIDPDFDDGFKNGVHNLFSGQRDGTSWGSIAAWAWGLSRAMDYFETDNDIGKVFVIGHSRLGKTALWAGATDERFSLVISNNSGCGGAALSRRTFGETVGRINSSFPHWFCDNYKKYNENEGQCPVDQHMLIALMAPRPVYVGSAAEDRWADPKGEFLSCVAASPVYEMLGLKGLPSKAMPELSTPVTGTIGYHIRPGKHNLTSYDWQRYMDFADKHFGKPSN
jgi:hypothetical protein